MFLNAGWSLFLGVHTCITQLAACGLAVFALTDSIFLGFILKLETENSLSGWATFDQCERAGFVP